MEDPEPSSTPRRARAQAREDAAGPSHHPSSFQSRQQQRRVSADSTGDQTVSTSSPFQSPKSASFGPQAGLAPRPPQANPEPVPDPAFATSTPRRRRESKDPERPFEQGSRSSALPPTAPDVPRIPPTAYRDSYPDEAPPRASKGHSRTASTTARPIPVENESRKIESRRAHAEPPTSGDRAATQEKPQRSSRPATTARDPQSSRQDPRSVPRPERSDRQRTVSSRQAPTGPTQAQPARRRASDSRGASASQRREWAPDRSPLQKLELTLQDITKEEKRAHVEEAELLAQEASRRGTRDPTRRRSEGPSSQSARGSRPTNDQLAEGGQARNPASQQRDRVQRTAAADLLKPRVSSQGTRAVSEPVFDGQEQQYPSTVARDPSRRKPVPQADSARDREGTRAVAAPLDTERRLSRATAGDRIQGQAISRSATTGGQPRDTSLEMRRPMQRSESRRRSVLSRAIQAGRDVAFGRRASIDDPRRSEEDGLRYDDEPPIATSRKAAGLLGQSSSNARAPASRLGGLTSHLPHRHHNAQPAQPYIAPKEPDEWKLAATARLTLADRSAEKVSQEEQDRRDKAWWEKDAAERKAGRAKAKRRGQSAGDSLPDDTQAQLDGMSNSNHSGVDVSGSAAVHGNSGFSNAGIRSRQYLEVQGTPSHLPRILRRDWVSEEEQAPLDPRRRSLTNPLFLAFVPYSYSCPHLSEHDRVAHPFHVCGPEDDMLITSMRGIRVRTAAAPSSFRPQLYLKCGPLLRYLGITQERASAGGAQSEMSTPARQVWRGSVMIVTTDADSSYEPVPKLQLFAQPMKLLPPPPSQVDGGIDALPAEYVDPLAGLPTVSRTGQTIYIKPVEHLEEARDLSRLEDDQGLFEETRSPLDPEDQAAGDGSTRVPDPNARPLGNIKEVKGFRLHAERGLTFWRFNIEVELGPQQARIAYRINRGPPIGFWVPAIDETMNIMFHSCNGFSLSINPDQYSGPDPLWRDVLNTHQTRPFHVMIGGGDQVYNDAVTRQTTEFEEWLSIKNPTHKYSEPFTMEMRTELEVFYLERYAMWFSQGLFGVANSQIPMVNLWDDHDIIDGYGSYPHHSMKSPVMCGLGGIAFKYYMLFQHQSVPSELEDEPSWLIGASPGPYINELSRSVFVSLGKSVKFLGIDCRTERTREEILTEQTYDLIFDRCKREIIKGETKHLMVLLGVPIAYPRLVWLENLLTSRIMDPVKAVGRSGMLGGLLNQFDGGVEILDDLDDHWTAKSHKDERNWFIQELQELAADKSVRVTILSGDVHLAAVGQFYSNPKLGIPKDQDHRYMPNVISSAIANAPPPEVMGDILNKRNKVHHLDHETDEDMIPLFTHDVDGKSRNNKRLLPRRNWCSIREYNPGATPPPTPPLSEAPPSPSAEMQERQRPLGGLVRRLSQSARDGRPGQLLRRLSQRREGSPYGSMDYDSASPNGRSRPPVSFRRPRSRTPSPRRVQSNESFAVDDADESYFPPQRRPSTVRRSISQGGSGNGAAAPVRPTPFHRQTTGLLEGKKRSIQAAQRAGLDLEAHHIDLHQGLDIILNCEVSSRDPSGITMPYRLLVPALHYDGPGDANHLARPGRQASVGGRLIGLLRTTSKRYTSRGLGADGADSQSEDDDGYDDERSQDLGRAASVPRQQQQQQQQQQLQPDPEPEDDPGWGYDDLRANPAPRRSTTLASSAKTTTGAIWDWARSVRRPGDAPPTPTPATLRKPRPNISSPFAASRGGEPLVRGPARSMTDPAGLAAAAGRGRASNGTGNGNQPGRRLSKAERVIGLGLAPVDNFEPPPPPRGGPVGYKRDSARDPDLLYSDDELDDEDRDGDGDEVLPDEREPSGNGHGARLYDDMGRDEVQTPKFRLERVEDGGRLGLKSRVKKVSGGRLLF